MADENILLRYLTDLPTASSIADGDLFHVNQGGDDKSVSMVTLMRSIVNGHHPVGKVLFFANTANPNTLFPGSTWARLPGAGRVVRIATNDADVGTTGGSDTVNLSIEQMPAHSHVISLTTQAHNFGTVTTSTAGNHNHTATCSTNGNHNHRGGARAPGANWGSGTSGTDNQKYIPYNRTSDAGNHAHTVTVAANGNHNHTIALPAHSHGISGNTNDTGNGAGISIINQYIKLAAWYRTA